MAETKPGVELDSEDICQACRHREFRKKVDYDDRFEELRELVDEYRRDNYYDCIIPVSGGKDSHYQTYIMSEKLDMNPLLVAVVDPFTKTEVGTHNLDNLTEAFDCDLMTINLGRQKTRKMMRIAFEELGSPAWPVDRAIYCAPIQIGLKMDIPLIVYGENVSWEYGGVQHEHGEKEDYSAKDQVKNDVAKDVDFDMWLDNGVEMEDLNMMQYPSLEEIEDAGLEPIYLSYFRPWDGHKNYQIAKRFGFRILTASDWDREGYIEDYNQIDTLGYRVEGWLKYPKYGFRGVTDVVGYWRRSDIVDITLNEGKELIKEHDHILNEQVLDDFLDFTGYSNREFWKIVDGFRNEDLFEESFFDAGKELRPKDDFENLDI
jgi:N-acetyl sugar amidotransferase